MIIDVPCIRHRQGDAAGTILYTLLLGSAIVLYVRCVERSCAIASSHGFLGSEMGRFNGRVAYPYICLSFSMILDGASLGCRY